MMLRTILRQLARSFFLIYLAVLPGSIITVALDSVPDWGAWIGGALLLLQGAAALCWLLGSHGRRGALAGLLTFLLAWAVEYSGVITGFPFGRYSYTAVLQPQLPGGIPLAITCAWLMVAVGAGWLARRMEGWLGDGSGALQASLRRAALAATLVLLLDLQIETVATQINRYWVWRDRGPYYGVPSANFVGWWLVGLLMAWLLDMVLYRRRDTTAQLPSPPQPGALALPAYLYMMNTLMFAVINLARGFLVAGSIGLTVLLVAGLLFSPAFVARVPRRRLD